MKLDIGCGRAKLDGYTGVDFYTPADIKANMWEIPLPDGSVEEIYSSHALEHVSMYMIHQTLNEWWRLLPMGGKLIVQVPNLDYCCRYYLTGPDRAWAEAILFGNQEHEGEFHKCGFQPMMLRQDLENAGFRVDAVEILWAYNQETLRAVAYKIEKKTPELPAQPKVAKTAKKPVAKKKVKK